MVQHKGMLSSVMETIWEIHGTHLPKGRYCQSTPNVCPSAKRSSRVAGASQQPLASPTVMGVQTTSIFYFRISLYILKQTCISQVIRENCSFCQQTG